MQSAFTSYLGSVMITWVHLGSLGLTWVDLGDLAHWRQENKRERVYLQCTEILTDLKNAI